MKKIAPSFLAADIWQAAKQIELIENAGCEYLHLDIMDGHFVPNISFGSGLVRDLRPHSNMIFDTHFMVKDPDFFVPEFAKAGADIITVHAETCTHLDRSLRGIRNMGLKTGVVLNPATPLCMIEEVLDLCDLVLLMSVNPGFGGQSFIENSISRLEKLADMRSKSGEDFLIEIDGGVDTTNAKRIAAAGADILVAGSAVFGQSDPAAAYIELASLINS